MATKKHLRVKVNGRDHDAEIEPRLLLVHFIRDLLALTGTHVEHIFPVGGRMSVNERMTSRSWPEDSSLESPDEADLNRRC